MIQNTLATHPSDSKQNQNFRVTVHVRKPSSVAELLKVCKEEWANTITSYDKREKQDFILKATFQFLLPRVAESVIRFREQLFHNSFFNKKGHFFIYFLNTGTDQRFSPNKWNHLDIII